MEINLVNLYNKEIIYLDNDIDFKTFDDALIKNVENMHIKGYLKYTLSEEIEINLNVTGLMVLADTITLEEIKKNLDLEIKEIISETDANYANFFKNNKNILDINEILWENIVLEVPISFTQNSGKTIKGNGWQLNGSSKE